MQVLFLRTLMKDARRGLHSKVGDQPGFPYRFLLCTGRAFLGAGPNLSLINDKSSHGDIYHFNPDLLAKAMWTTQEF
jgi:hypothetical protein